MPDADLPRCRSCFAVLRFITLTSGNRRYGYNPKAVRAAYEEAQR